MKVYPKQSLGCLAVSVSAGIQGPYPASKFTNIKIFNNVLRIFLEPTKRIEADKGYHGHPDNIKCCGNDTNPAENWAMQGRVRVSRDAEWVAEDLGDSLPGLLSLHNNAPGCIPGVRGGYAAHHQER